MTTPPGAPAATVGVRGPAAPRTYVLRRGRMGPRSRAALGELWPRFGVDLPPDGGELDLPTIFGRRARVALEVGFGMGEATVAAARADPDTDLLAVDVHTPGVAALLRGLAAGGLDHVRVAEADAREVLARLPAASLDEVRVWFPDPWPKVRHHKRRLVTPEFAATVADRLRPGGRVHLATDHEEYAAQMLAVVAGEHRLVNEHGGYAPGPTGRPTTRFERHGLGRGHRIRDVVVCRPT
ncbi:MAG: tRNA (guanosine(46)-N7)-methyltransferase TrmB [Kineosporiaceae bacterium]